MTKDNQRFLSGFPCASFIVADISDFHVVYGNEAFFELYGHDKEEFNRVYGNRLSAITDKTDLKLMSREISDSRLKGKNSVTVQGRVRKSSGDIVWLCTSFFKLDKQMQEYCGISIDVTPVKRLEQECHSRQMRMDGAFHVAGIGLFEFCIDRTGGSDIHYLCGLDQLFLRFPFLKKRFPFSLLKYGEMETEHKQLLEEYLRSPKKDMQELCCRLKIVDDQEQSYWYKLDLKGFFDIADGDFILLGILMDITNYRETEFSYIREAQYYQAVMSEAAAYGEVDVTENRIIRCGGVWTIYNEIVDSMTYGDLLFSFIDKVVHPMDREWYKKQASPENLLRAHEAGEECISLEFRRILEQNQMVWMEFTANLFVDSLTGHLMAILHLKNIDAQVKGITGRQINLVNDPLTDVCNRQTGELIIRRYLIFEGNRGRHALLLLDLDDFRKLNDDSGHDFGDHILIQITEVIKRSFRSDDIICRYGGDEFLVLLKHVSSQEQVQERALELQKRVSQITKGLSATIGIALTSGMDCGYEWLFSRARKALIMGRRQGKGKLILYNNIYGAEDQREEQFLFSSVEGWDNEEDQKMDGFLREAGEISYLVDADTYKFVKGNQAFYRRIGMLPGECIGRYCYELLQNRLTPCPFCSEVNWSVDKYYLWTNYNPVLEQQFLMKNRIVKYKGRKIALCVAVDISNNKSIVDSLKNGCNEENIVLSCIYRMAKCKSQNEVIMEILETMANFFQADHALLWEGEIGGLNRSCKYEWKKENLRTIGQKGSLLEYAPRSWREKLKNKTPVYINSPEEVLTVSMDIYRMMKECRLKNIRWIPLADGDEFIGYITLANISANFFNESFMESLGYFVGHEVMRRRLQEKQEYAHYHDSLTGLLNRNSYEDYIVKYNPDEVESIGIVCADINSLKHINESQGQKSGDRQICMLADAMVRILDGSNVYRLSGDEFLAIFENANPDEFIEKIRRFKEWLSRGGNPSVALGQVWENREKELQPLVNQATELMCYDKQCYYDNKDLHTDPKRYDMLDGLLRQLSQKRFVVYFQSKVDLKGCGLAGAEALIRYADPERGIIPPGKFIGLLEEYRFVRYVDLFVFEEVLRFLERCMREGKSLIPISLNFSRLTLLEQGILPTVEAIADQYDVPRKYIEIEITESVGEVGREAMYRTIRELRRAGFAISLDDFGTKYTNLSIVTDIEFDVLKIDRGLMSTLVNNETNRIVVHSVIAMCSAMGIEVVAEGVETAEQELILKEMGCPVAQGYLYGKPVPMEEFESQLKIVNPDRSDFSQ